MTLIWSRKSLKDLKGIFDYYKESAGEETARRLVFNIKSGAEKILIHPMMGPLEPFLVGRPEEFRFVLIGSWKIIYWQGGLEVIIATVFDVRRNPNEMLR